MRCDEYQTPVSTDVCPAMHVHHSGVVHVWLGYCGTISACCVPLAFLALYFSQLSIFEHVLSYEGSFFLMRMWFMIEELWRNHPFTNSNNGRSGDVERPQRWPFTCFFCFCCCWGEHRVVTSTLGFFPSPLSTLSRRHKRKNVGEAPE